MKRILILVLILVITLTLGYGAINFIGRNAQSDSEQSNPSQVANSSAGPATSSDSAAGTTVAADPIKTEIEAMSLEEKIGQLVIAGVEAYENDQYSKQLIEQYHVGGFILFKKNIQNAEQMLTLLNSLKETNKANKNSLFLSIDEEGGRVSRLPSEFVKFPTNKKIGQLNDENLSYQVGSIIGEELSAFGFNMNFAPVLDINSNPKNPVIGDRSFGPDAETVSKLGTQTMLGMQSQNITSVVKHFPGHGDTSVDSHVGLPVVTHDIDRLKSFELLPFASAIENGCDAVMVAHILLPKIDGENPASFSKTIITDILREDMKFEGVVITDDFTMGAIIKNYDIGEAAVKSVLAGSDIVLVCHGYDKQETVIKALKAAAQTGKLTMDRIDQSVYRILKLKDKYNLSSDPAQGIEPKIINDKIRLLFQ